MIQRYLPLAIGLFVICVAGFTIASQSLPAAIPVGAAAGAVVGVLMIYLSRFRTKIRVASRLAVNGAPAEVFALASDPRNMPRYMPQSLAVQADGPLQVGALFHVRLRRGRAERRSTFEVTAYNPPVSIVAQPWFRGRPSRFRKTGLTVTGENGRSIVVSWTEVETSGVLAPWIRSALQRAEAEGAAAMKKWLEAQQWSDQTYTATT